MISKIVNILGLVIDRGNPNALLERFIQALVARARSPLCTYASTRTRYRICSHCMLLQIDRCSTPTSAASPDLVTLHLIFKHKLV